MGFACLLFLRGVLLIAEDYSRPEVGRAGNTVGLIITALLACASAFEAYRFLNFFFAERQMRRALRHFN
jgi:hypothetical protein